MTKSEIRKRDGEFAAEVRARGACEWGRSHSVQLQCAHIFSRRHRAIRWDENNDLCLCAGCNFWAHHNPVLFADFVRDYLGLKKFNALLRTAKTVIGKYKTEED